MAMQSLNGFDASLQRVVNVGTATQPGDAVNLAQVQALLAGLSWHQAVRVSSTGNVTVSSPGAAIDGVNLTVGDRVLLKNQTTATENGVWVWQGATSAMTRPQDGTTNYLKAGAAFYVDEGTTNQDTAWTLATDDPITVGTTSLSFVRFGGAGSNYTQGTGILISGGVISIDTSIVPRKFSTNVGDGTATTITVTHNLGTKDVDVTLFNNSTGADVWADATRNTTNTVTFTMPSAPAAGAYRAVIQG
jgi:hypothetical protein